MSPALDAPYATDPGELLVAETDEILIIEPLVFFNDSYAACEIFMGASKF
jgi:hypothetical protein